MRNKVHTNRITNMERQKRYSAQQAVDSIRKWILERDDDDEDDNSEDECESSDADVEPDEQAASVRTLDADTGSEGEDNVEENDDTDSCLSRNDDDDNDSNSGVHETAATSIATGVRYVARSGRVWSQQAPPVARAAAVNVVTHASGPTTAAAEIQTALAAFRAFIDDDMCESVIKHTNEEGGLRNQGWQPMNRRELDALLGLLILSGVYNMSKVSVRLIWSRAMTNSIIYKATLSRSRFESILTYLRFDDKTTRAERREGDKFAPIRELFERFTHNCRRLWSPSECVTVDEQLVGFRGRCPFRQYLPSKPDKYGIKLWACADPANMYTLNMLPYLGRDETRDKSVPVGTHVVLKLTEQLNGSGRNVTCDNFFTSIMLADKLYSRRLTLLGTMKSNLREIPVEFKPARQREVGTSLFGFDGEKTIVSYVPKPNKAVVLLSTMHRDDRVDDVSKKPDMIIDYNNTKYAVDVVDQLCHKYTVKRATRRWPLCVFYNLVDVAAINASIVFVHNVPTFHPKRNYKRRLFLEELAMQLIREQLEHRSQHPEGLQEPVRCALQSLGFPGALPQKPVARQNSTAPIDKKRKRCHLCSRNHDRKVATRCSVCAEAVCPEHSSSIATVLCDACK